MWSGEERIRPSNTKLGRTAFLVLIVFSSQNVLAAELQELPPVAVTPPGASPPPAPSSVPPSPVPPSAPPPVVPMPPVPPMPEMRPAAEMVPPGQVPLLPPPLPPPLPTTAAPETIPQVSQPLRPVSPETIAETEKKVEEEGVYFNVADEDIREVIKQISRALGKNFIIDDKLRGKITIISERKMTKDEIWETFQSALDVNGYTIVQGPAGLLRLVPTREAISNPIDLYTDASPFSDRFITRLITLRNISATDMANVIKGLVSKEGNLFSYPVTNTLILTDKGTNIDRLLRLINELDQEGPQEVIEIIPILYADAKDIAGKITQIFETEKDEAKSVAAPPSRRGKEGGETATLQEVPRLRKVIPDERTNSLIVLASKMAIKKVRDLIKKLDSPLLGEEGEVHVYYLKHAAAKDMATVLTAISGAVQQAKEKKGGGGGGTSAAEAAKTAVSSLVGGAEFAGKFSVSADETTNALIITASSKDYNTLLEQVISKLDIPRRQVYVEAVIVELSVSQDQQLGAGLLGGKTFGVGGNDLAAFGSTFGFLDPTQLLSGTIGAVNTGGTFKIPATPTTPESTVPSFFSAIQFAQANNNANILSTPNILTLDNQEAEIQVGQRVQVPSTTQPTTSGTLPFTTFTSEDVTLSLKIKPQINEGGTVRLEVTQEDREIVPPNVKSPTGGGFTTTKRSIKTAIVATNGQTVVLGGLIKDKNTIAINKVPLLGDIPILGYLFKTRKKVKEKVNLVVFLTPHIIQEPKDFLGILQKKINEQNAFIADNFGKGQQKQIRDSLETHAAHLLEFQGEVPPAGTSVPSSEEEKFPMEPAPAKKPQASAPSGQAAPPPPSTQSKAKPAFPAPAPDDDIDLAY